MVAATDGDGEDQIAVHQVHMVDVADGIGLRGLETTCKGGVLLGAGRAEATDDKAGPERGQASAMPRGVGHGISGALPLPLTRRVKPPSARQRNVQEFSKIRGLNYSPVRVPVQPPADNRRPPPGRKSHPRPRADADPFLKKDSRIDRPFRPSVERPSPGKPGGTTPRNGDLLHPLRAAAVEKHAPGEGKRPPGRIRGGLACGPGGGPRLELPTFSPYPTIHEPDLVGVAATSRRL